MSEQISRRNILKVGAALTAVAATSGFAGVFGLRKAFAADDDPQTILNIAATAETFAVTHYYRALQELQFSEGEKAYMTAAMESELIHLEFLNANGGKALTEEFYFPEGTFADKKMLGTVTAVAETVFVAAYLAATRRFAELSQPLLAMVASQVAVVEGQHLLFMRGLAGNSPANNIALGDPLFYNVSDAVPVISGLLDGKSEVAGIATEKTAVKYPGAEAARMVIGKSALEAPKPATDPKTFPKM
ncbi:MAG: ferritin-like domain-containing protein [Anaerolineae bacterium]|nr:ferritin-like domain-containing protein [Anaerolineae bacterium]